MKTNSKVTALLEAVKAWRVADINNAAQQQQMVRDAMKAIAERKPGRTKLVYDKTKRTIVAVAEGTQTGYAGASTISQEGDLDALTHQLRIAADNCFTPVKKTKPEKYLVLFQGTWPGAKWLVSYVNPKLSGSTARQLRGRTFANFVNQEDFLKPRHMHGAIYQAFPVGGRDAFEAIKGTQMLGVVFGV